MIAQNEINAKWELAKKAGNRTFSYTVADWDSMGRVITQTRGRAFQTLG